MNKQLHLGSRNQAVLKSKFWEARSNNFLLFCRNIQGAVANTTMTMMTIVNRVSGIFDNSSQKSVVIRSPYNTHGL